LREWLERWLGVGKAQRLRAETRAEALTTAYRHKLVTELHNLKILDMAKPFDEALRQPFDGAQDKAQDGAQDRPFDLETSYVPLQVRECNRHCCATGDGGEFSGRAGESEMVKRKDSVGDLRPSMSPEEALLRFHHLAVLGDPGAGKTTLLKYLTLLAATSPLSPTRVGGNLPDFPILVPLGHFAAVPQVNLLDFVISQIEARYGFPEPRPEPAEGPRPELAEGPRPDGSTGSPRWLAEGPRPDGSTGSPRWLAEGPRPEPAEGPRPEPAEGPRPEPAEGPRPDGSTGSPRWLAEGPRPELAEGPRPELAEGPRPELAEGPRPELAEGPRPELAEGLRPYLEERLEEGSVLFLLDGLDEANVGDHSAEPFVPRSVLSPSTSLGIDSVEALRTEGLTTKPQEAEATYRHVVGQINVLAARYPNCPMVVTVRRGSWKGLLAARFHTVELLEFNRGDIQRFIVNWFGASSDRARDLQDALSQNPRMGALATNPLLLSLMALVFEQDRKLPEGRAGLYGRSVELLLNTADRKNLPDTEHKRRLLEEVALHFHLRRVLLLSEDELRGIIAAFNELRSPISRRKQKGTVDIPAEQVPTPPSAPPLTTRRSAGQDSGQALLRAGLEEISSLHGLLQERISGWVGFPHPTWQEYFAAAAISKGGQLEWVLEGLHDPWWEGTALFLAGVLEDATPLLEGILAQEEDIFHSNLLLAGRCLAVCGLASTPQVEEVGLDIIEELRGLVEGGYHRLLQRQAISVLAEIGGEAVVSFFVALLRREEIDLNVRAEVAKILGSLRPFGHAQDRDKSMVLDLLAFLTDEKLAPSVRRNIAEALGSLGDESVIPPLLALLPDETVDPSVRGKVVEALVTLGGANSVSPLLALLPNEGIDPTVRERIIEVLASLDTVLSSVEGLSPSSILHPPVVSQLLSLVPDEEIHPSVRRGVAEAVGSLGDESVVPDLLALLPEEEIDPSVRRKVAEALGNLGDASAVHSLLAILGDEKVDYSVRMVVAEVLGVLGENSASQLLALLSDEKIDPDVRASIAGALGALGEKSVVPQLLALLPDERIDPAVRWRIVDALSSLGDKTIIPHLRPLLPNEKIDSSVRWMVAEALETLARERRERREITEIGEMEEALGSLNDRSRVPQLLALLKDKKLDPPMSGRIIEALGSLGNDRATVEGLAALLDREDIGSRVYEALFQVSRRAGMRVFARKGAGYEVRP
jgi:HEAT repeat protein